ncbi:LppP/LprE family lipoprotein [Nocardia sp. NPDC050193]
MTVEVADGLPVHHLIDRTHRTLDDLALAWMHARGDQAPTGAEIERDRRRETILTADARNRLRGYHIARFALAASAKFDHHARCALEDAQRYGATYQQLGAPLGLSRQLVQRRYGVTVAERAAADKAIADAVQTLAPFPALPDARWSATPIAHNFSTETELSAALVTLENATASTPVHILLFHYGQYLGTGTDDAQPDVHLLATASTNSVVTIEFHEPGTPHAGPHQAIHTARFRWLDDRVQWFGTLPPEVTSSTAACGYIRYFATTSHAGDLFSCHADYVHEGHLNGSTVLRVQRPDRAIEYLSGTRYDDDPLTWTSGADAVTIHLADRDLRTYPAGTDIREATAADLRHETQLLV